MKSGDKVDLRIGQVELKFRHPIEHGLSRRAVSVDLGLRNFTGPGNSKAECERLEGTQELAFPVVANRQRGVDLEVALRAEVLSHLHLEPKRQPPILRELPADTYADKPGLKELGANDLYRVFPYVVRHHAGEPGHDPVRMPAGRKGRQEACRATPREPARKFDMPNPHPE